MELSDKELIKQFKNQGKRKELLNSLDNSRIADLIIQNVDSEFSLNFWHFVLSDMSEKLLFKLVADVLPRLNRDSMSLRQFQDFITRFTIELNKRSSRFVLKVALLSSEILTAGDSRALFYKDVMPICLKILQRDGSKILTYNEVSKSGKEFRLEIIYGILRREFPIAILSTLVAMFK